MERVVQLDKTGCGIGCLAILTNKTYHIVKREICCELKMFCIYDKFFGTTYKKMYQLLRFYKKNFKFKRKFKNWVQLNGKVAILEINKNKKTKNWHWVVYKNGVIYDPSFHVKNYPRKDFGRINPRAFIEIL